MPKPLFLPIGLHRWLVRSTYHSDPKSTAAMVVRMAIGIVAISVLSILLAQSILFGFYYQTPAHIQDFAGHMILLPYDSTLSFTPIHQRITNSQAHEIVGLRPYMQYPALLKTPQRVKGVQFKGIAYYPMISITPSSPSQIPMAQDAALQKRIIQGRNLLPIRSDAYTKECVLGIGVARFLDLQVGDTVIFHFIGRFVQYRKLQVVGLFQTGLEEVDEHMVLGDLRVLQKLSQYNDKDQVDGIEVLLSSSTDLVGLQQRLGQLFEYKIQVLSLEQIYPQIFEWLEMLRRNVYIFLALVLLVAGFNMVAIGMIFIMERSYMMGVLKALGMPVMGLQSVFLSYGLIWVAQGLLWGNALALVVVLLQRHWGVLRMDPANYVLDRVPMHLGAWDWLGYNALCVGVLLVALCLPLRMLSRLSPVGVLRW